MPPHGGSPFSSDYIEGKAFDSKLIKRLLRYVIPHRKLIFLAMFFMLISTTLELLIPYISKVGIDRYLARLYQIYQASPAAVDVFLGSDESDLEYIVVDSCTVLILKASLESLDEPERTEFIFEGELLPETYYLFPAENFTGTTGQVKGDFWLVPETELSKVPVNVLLQIRGADISGVTKLALLIGVTILLGLVSGYGHVVTLGIAGQKSMFDLRTRLFEHIQKLSLKFFDSNPIGRLVTRVTNDIEALNEMFAAVLVNLVKDVFLLTGTIIILFMMNVRLALAAVVIIPVFFFVSMIFRLKVRGAYREVRRLLASLNSRLAEDLAGIKIVQVFRKEKLRRIEYSKTNAGYFRANMKRLVIFGIFRPMIEIIASTGVAVVLIYGGFNVLSGALTLGTLIAFISYVRQMFRPLADMSEKYNIMQSAMASAERVFKIMDEEPEIKDSPDQVKGLDIKGHVEFQCVSFSYVPEKPVLRNVSFSVEPGKSVALVGPTGAGKTSIISLLCRFYDPNEGCVKIDGRDLRDIPVTSLRKNIAIVLQDAFIFSRNIEENIKLGKNLSGQEIQKAAQMVQANGFIEKLPEGYSEIMAERGSTLSTGQKQLICFARALAHDPKILILDEATSSVDPSTENLIQQAIGTLMTGRTSIIVAHRLSTIQKADEILVIDDGRILERGNHQELLARRGIYYNLYLLQYREA